MNNHTRTGEDKSMLLHHITLNTGHVASLPRVDQAVTRKVSRLAREGGPIGDLLPKMNGWSVSVELRDGCALFSLNFSRAPISDTMVCWRDDIAERAWNYHEAFYMRLSDTMAQQMSATEAPQRPVETPWAATLLMPTISLLPQTIEMGKAVAGAGELERIIAWAIIDNAEGE